MCAGPTEIIWTETVRYERAWDGERFSSIREEVYDMEFRCWKCGAMVPRPDEDVMNEALNN